MAFEKQVTGDRIKLVDNTGAGQTGSFPPSKIGESWIVPQTAQNTSGSDSRTFTPVDNVQQAATQAQKALHDAAYSAPLALQMYPIKALLPKDAL